MSVPPVPELGAELTGLSHPKPAGVEPFLVEGRRVRIEGVQSRSRFRIAAGARVLAEVVPDGLGTAANVLLFPGVVRRDFAGREGTRVETLLTSPRLPLVVCQWRGSGSTPPSGILLEIPRPARPAGSGRATDPAPTGGMERGRDHVLLSGDDDVLYVGLSPAPATIDVVEVADGGVRLHFQSSGISPVSLVVAHGDDAASLRSTVAAARHLGGHAVRATAGPEGGLALHTGAGELDDSVLWLRSRLPGRIRSVAEGARRQTPVDGAVPSPTESTLLSLGLAALGAGDRESAGLALSPFPDASPCRAVLAARFASVFGDTGPALAVMECWLEGEEPRDHVLLPLAARLLADALDRTTPPREVARLRRWADEGSAETRGTQPAPGEAMRSGRSLPTVGGGDRLRRPVPGNRRGGQAASGTGAAHAMTGDVSWWRGLLEGAPVAPVPFTVRSDVTEARRGCARFATDPDSAWSAWRALLGAPSAATLWDLPGEETEWAGSLTAELLLGISAGLLGMVPDAPAGRLRLATRLPSHLTAFSASGLRMGACELRLDYRRSDGLHTFELLPEAAPVPPLVVFEPFVPGTLRSVVIDGEPAELEVVRRGARFRAPVQLPVDRPRRIEIETRGGAP